MFYREEDPEDSIAHGHITSLVSCEQFSISIKKNKKHSENIDTSTSVTFDLEV